MTFDNDKSTVRWCVNSHWKTVTDNTSFDFNNDNIQEDVFTGIVIHRGDTMNSGHYYSITHCWDNGNAFKFNDSDDPKFVNNDDFDTEREEAYMLVFCKKPNEQDAVVNPTERTNV